MWFRQRSIVTQTIIICFLGCVAMCGAQRWRPTNFISPACVDSMQAIRTIKYASCDSGQVLSYMRDLDGASYLICRCHGRGNLNEEPEIPSLIFREKELQQSAPHVSERDPTEETL